MNVSAWLRSVCVFPLAILVGGCPLTGGSTVPATVPDFGAARFSDPTRIDNPLFPVAPGGARTYRADTADGPEETLIEMLSQTRVLMGVSCCSVRDRVFRNGILIEDTTDYYAQDDLGNVWYMGEVVDNYNYDSAGMLIDITHEGAWLAGEDVAGLGVLGIPGYQMLAAPRPGDAYHQEYYRGAAEDTAAIVAVEVTVTLADGSTYQCVQTRDENPLDSGVGFKYYAPGIGVVLETAPDGSERSELVSIGP